jgi:predicted branched-subunit amino acid permease
MQLGIRSSGAYFFSTFLFGGVMFGITASAVGLGDWQALVMSATSFTASAQFAALEFWTSPLPYGTIALTVALVSSRNILLGMAMAHHFDGHSLGRRIAWLFLLNEGVDRLGYITGYGISMMVSWLISTLPGLSISDLFANFDLASAKFAGPLVMATMMMLFIKGSRTRSTPWIFSGVSALVLHEFGVANYLILLISVATGVAAAVLQQRLARG